MTTQIFQKRIELEVPARGTLGPSPTREETFSFVIPDTYEVVRSPGEFGATVTEVNFGGLTERRRDFRSIPNGIELIWKLSNGEVFPVTGRRASIDLQLTGNSVQSMEFSARYEKLRERFFADFFFDGHVAESLDPGIAGGKVIFGDHTIYLGFALMAMATEVAILTSTGTDVATSKRIIHTLLDTINVLDDVAEVYCGTTSELNGFFLRDNISGPTDSRLGNRFSQCDSDFQNPSAENATPSGDQIFGMMFGLSAVMQFVDDAGITSKATDICKRLFDYARRNYFVLQLPNGDATKRGSDMRWLSSLLHGLQEDITHQDLFADSKIKVLGLTLPLTGIASFWDDPVTARQIADLAGRELHIPVIGSTIELNSFALHLLLMAIAHGDVWSQSELEAIAMKDQHHLSVLLYCLRHPGKLPVAFDRSDITEILAACPDTGPAESLASSSNWYKDNRWIRSGNLGEPTTGGSAIYNGLDWMILHNLDQLLYVGG